MLPDEALREEKPDKSIDVLEILKAVVYRTESMRASLSINATEPFQLLLHVALRHEARPPPDLSPSFESYVLLIHRRCS